MVKEAIELVLASRRERGEEIPAESGKPELSTLPLFAWAARKG